VKEAARNNDISFNRIPKSEISERPEHSQVANPMGSNYKRVNNKTVLPNHPGQTDDQNQINTKLDGYRNRSRQNKAYLHHFKIIESPACPCDGGNQTVGHLLCDCTKLRREREKLISNILKQENWPVNKSDLVNKYIKHFIRFTNSIDSEKL